MVARWCHDDIQYCSAEPPYAKFPTAFLAHMFSGPGLSVWPLFDLQASFSRLMLVNVFSWQPPSLLSTIICWSSETRALLQTSELGSSQSGEIPKTCSSGIIIQRCLSLGGGGREGAGLRCRNQKTVGVGLWSLVNKWSQVPESLDTVISVFGCGIRYSTWDLSDWKLLPLRCTRCSPLLLLSC